MRATPLSSLALAVLFVVLGVPFASAHEEQKPTSPPGQSQSDAVASSPKDTATQKTPPGQQSKSNTVTTSTSGTATTGQSASVQSDALVTATTTKSATRKNGATRQAPSVVAPPSISGVVVVGATLTATTGAWSGSPTSYAYQWRRCDSAGASCVGVSGSTSSSYSLSSGDSGSTMRVVVTASNRYGSQSATSAATSAVLAATPIPVAGSYPASFFTVPAGSGNVLPASGAFFALG